MPYRYPFFVYCTIIVQFQLKPHLFPHHLAEKLFYLSLHPKQPYMKYKLIVLDLDGTLTISCVSQLMISPPL